MFNVHKNKPDFFCCTKKKILKKKPPFFFQKKITFKMNIESIQSDVIASKEFQRVFKKNLKLEDGSPVHFRFLFCSFHSLLLFVHRNSKFKRKN